jgi:hypothetical protein
MPITRSEFLRRRSNFFDREEDEEEEILKPSRQASFEQRRKQFFEEEKKRIKEPERVEPPTEPEPPKEPSVIERAKRFVSGIFKREEEPEEEIPAEEAVFDKVKNAYLNFPTIFPNPDNLGFRVSNVREELEKQGATEAVANFWSDPIDNSLQAARDFLDNHPKGLDTLAEAQKFIEDFEYTDPVTRKKVPVGLNKNPLHRGIAEGVSLNILGSSNDVQAVFDTQLNHSVTVENQAYETVGSVIGQVMSFVAGGSVLKGMQFGKATLPVLFATLGQTSAPPETTIKQRVAKLPVDVATGWLFTRLPVFKRGGITSENVKTLFKGTLGAAGVGGGSGFLHALIEGKSKEEAIEMAAKQAAVFGLFHIVASSIGLLDQEIRGLKEIKGKGTFTPEQVRENIRRANAENTPMGKDLLKLADTAEVQGKDIEINMTKFQQGLIGKGLGISPKEEEALVGVGELVGRKPALEPKAKPKEKAIKPVEKPKVPVKPKELTAKVDLLVLHEDAPDKALVESVKKQIQAGKEIEPVLVIREGEKYGIEDGKHRYQAYKELGYEEVPIKLTEAKKTPVKKPVIPSSVAPETTLYHGTTPELATAIKKKGIAVTKDTAATYGAGVYLSDSSEVAKDYGESVVQIKPTKELKLYTPKEDELAEIRDLFGGEQMDYVRSLLGEKYDGLVVPERAGDGNEIVIYDPSLLSITEPAKPPAKKPTIQQERQTLVQKQLDKGGEVVKKLPEGVIQVSPLGELVATYALRKEVKGTVKETLYIYDEDNNRYIKLAKVVPTKPLEPTRKPKKPTKPPEPTRKPVKKKKAIPPKKKKIVFTRRVRETLTEELKGVLVQGETQSQAVRNLDTWLKRNLAKPKSLLQNKRLKAIKADLNRQMFEIVGANTGNWKRDYAYFQSLRHDPDSKDLVTRMEKGIFEIDSKLAAKELVGKPAGYASKGEFSTVQSLEKEVNGIKAVEFPELLRLAEQFGQRPKLNRRLRTAYGRAKGVLIDLNPKVFEDEDIIGKVLAHEIGHIGDYLPDKTMARGNLVGRIASLNKHLKKLYGELDDPKIRQELKDLSMLWKPFDEAQSLSYTKYRYSSVELYADAVSVLFNDPALLKQKAPNFYEGFFEYLDRKPVVKRNFEAVWDLLNQGEEAIFRKRDEHLNRSFEKGEEAYAAKYLDKTKRKTSLMYHVRILFDSVNHPIVSKINKLRKEGKEIPAHLNPDYALKGLIYSEGELKNYVNDNFQPAFMKAQEVNDGWNQLGKVLFYERVLNERGDLANPQGYSPKTAEKQLQSMKEVLSKKDWETLQEAKKMLRGAVRKSNKFAKENKYYTPELIKQMKANPAYATYQVVDYLDTYITPRVYRQKGTLKDIANPATSTVMKLISVHKAIKRNNVKKLNMEFLKTNFPDSITEARTRWNGKSLDIKDPQDPRQGMVIVIEEGKPQGYYVEKDIAEMLNFTSNTTLDAAARVSKLLSQSRFYRPLFTTYNFGFQTFNFVRDIRRAWKNYPQKTLKDVPLSPIFDAYKVGRGYVKATVPSFKHITNRPDDLIKEMENINILGFTYSDMYGGEVDPEAKQIERIFEKTGIFQKTKKKNLLTPFTWVLDKVQSVGDFIETLPKVAGYIELKGRMPEEELAEYIRTSIGSPAFRYRGKLTPVTNNLLLFSNAIKEGIKSDIRVAVGRKGKSTGASFWWKTILADFLPKFVMAAIAAGLLGKRYQKIMDKVSEYDKTNYTILPLGLDENDEAVYLRIPHDETGRFLGGLMWKAIQTAKNKELDKITDIFAFGAGQFPNLSPSFTGGGAVVQYLSGKNPYDSYRGRYVIPDLEFRAGTEESLPVLLDWLAKNQGLGIMFPQYVPDKPTGLQKILTAPFISNILGRWIKVSDFGEVEQLREIERAEEKKQAQRVLKERKVIDKAIEEYNENPSMAKKGQLEKQIVVEIVGTNNPRESDDKRKKTNTLKKFRIGILRGSVSPQLDVLINADTNAEKVSLLLTIEKQITKEEFDDLLELAKKEKIISDNVIRDYKKQKK